MEVGGIHKKWAIKRIRHGEQTAAGRWVVFNSQTAACHLVWPTTVWSDMVLDRVQRAQDRARPCGNGG